MFSLTSFFCHFVTCLTALPPSSWYHFSVIFFFFSSVFVVDRINSIYFPPYTCFKRVLFSFPCSCLSQRLTNPCGTLASSVVMGADIQL